MVYNKNVSWEGAIENQDQTNEPVQPSKRPTKLRLLVAVGLVVFLSILALVVYQLGKDRTADSDDSPTASTKTVNGFDLSTSTPHSIPLDQIVSGGPGRDGIPAIDSPKFTSASQASDIPETGLGILVDHSDQQRYYPYTILVWHEIVNDEFGDTPVAVTFCPLCGSAVVYERRINNQTVRFGVSGLLYESNLLMYDDATESLWSQSIGQAVVGPQTGNELTRLPTQLLDFATVKQRYPDVQVLSTDTGYSRQYGIDPYSGYGESDKLLFDVSVNDTRLPAKTIMFVIPLGAQSIAFEHNKLAKNSTLQETFFGQQVKVSKDQDGQITVTADGRAQPGYFEMWFSWATHHQNNGTLWVQN